MYVVLMNYPTNANGEKVEIISDKVLIAKTIAEVISRAKNSIAICVDKNTLKPIGIDQCQLALAGPQNKGVIIKFLTEITNENLEYSKEVMQLAQVQHIDGIKGNFVVTDTEYLGAAALENEQIISQLIYSNSKQVVDQHRFLFDNLWSNSLSQEDKIRQMEQGIEPEEIKILSNPDDIQHLYKDLLQSATSEISLIVSTPNALFRQQEIGIIELIKKAAIERFVKVNLVIPKYEKSSQNQPTLITRADMSEVNELPMVSNNIRVRRLLPSINKTSKIKSTILLADKECSLLIDLKDDLSQNFTDAIGFASYSNSKSRTQSYNFIFDTIWRQADVYEELEMKTIELEKLNTMQNEFINIAAHELRTPTQAILGYSDMLEQSPERNQMYEKTIARNAQRLGLLASDILDVARIESQTLKLNKSNFDLNQEAENVIKDVMERREWDKNGNSVNFIFEPKESIILFGDKQRIYQVLFNLVNNALKFTENGTITIAIEKQKNNAVITVTDTGMGIDREIQPRIFSKFATKSNSGTGLGLFISKAIVEAHGGHIQASNNLDEKGATFWFKLPLIS
jgi:two-component system, OmpR family, sensor histidine kinase VicK